MQKENGDLPIKFFVDSRKRVTITCPQCGISKTIDTTKLQPKTKVVNAKCKCGKHFKGEIEFRRFYRKTVRLIGEYIQLKNNQKGNMVVGDLSMGGLAFTCSRPHMIQVGDHLELIFRLDDANRSEIRIKAVARSVRDLFVGVERSDTSQYQQALGFYLM